MAKKASKPPVAWLGRVVSVALLVVVSALLLTLSSTGRQGSSGPSSEQFSFETAEISLQLQATLADQMGVRATQLSGEADEAERIFLDVPAEVQATPAGKELAAKIAAARNLASSMNPDRHLISESTDELREAVARVEEQGDKYTELMVNIETLLPGTTGAVALMDLETGQTLVSYNATEVFTAASTYKIFTAYSMINAVESGVLEWSSPFNGTTLQECFSWMLIYSDNDCPIQWFQTYGHDFVNEQAKELGAQNTALTYSHGLSTTAEDLAVSLRTLGVSDVISQKSRDFMLDLMSEQETRDGLPAAFEPDHGVVADKVGYLDELLHDAALIYTDKGDYSLVVLTRNSSWETIAAVGELIYDYL